LFGWNVRFMIYLVSIQLGTTDRQTNQTNSLTRALPTGQPDRSTEPPAAALRGGRQDQ
jgi:hypothetical protein